MKKISLFIIFILVAAAPAFAVTHTVKKDGTGDYTTIQACANAAQAGDTCLVSDGTYSGGVTPPRDGGAGYWITFKAAEGHSPVVTGSWNLEGRNYIIIDGFEVGGGFSSDPYSGTACGNIKILNNYINGANVGINLKGNDVLISGNTFNNMSNDMVRQFGDRWTIRNNTVIDETDSGDVHMDFWQSWCNDGVSASYLLIENNVFINVVGGNVHFSLINGTSSCGDPITNSIIRYNKVYNTGSLGCYIDQNQAASGQTDNSIYNNTWVKLGEGSLASWQTMAQIYNASTSSSGINNIFYDAVYPSKAIGFTWGSGGSQSYNLYYDPDNTMTFSGAASSETGAIKNQNPLLTDPNNNDFSLQAGSPAIDKGGPLTLVATADSGSGTSLIVDEAEFFQPGWGGADPDTIAVGSVSNVAQISSINYNTNTIILATPISRNDGDSVWLYKDSDGTVVLHGTAPDIGAHEFGGETLSPPVRSGGSPTGTLPSGTTSTTLSLSTNENATCRYSTTAGISYSSMTNTFSTTGGTSHSTTVSGLSDGNAYSYCVRCQNDSGDVNTTDYDITFSVAVPDFEPPTIPSDLQASPVSSSQINLTWTASTDNVGVTGYRIYRDELEHATSPTNSYPDNTALSPSTLYTYTVSAYDAAGNESSQSPSASATTSEASAVIEAESGTITSPMEIVSDAEASGGAYIQTIQADSGTAAYTFNTDESGTYKIIARVYASDGGSDSFYVKIDDGDEFIWHLNPSGNPDEFNVWREDEVNNQGTGAWDNPQYDPYTVDLTQGTHTITFRGRETNCRLDYFYFPKVEGLDEESPMVTITQPISGNTYSTEEDSINLGGSASDKIGVTSVTWTNSREGNGTASGTDNWTVSNIPLQEGDNTITVTARDAAGNTGSDTLTVTYTPPDFQPPTIPGNPQASPVSSSQINLTWTASTDNVGVTGYKIYRDGVRVDTSPTNSYPDTGLSPSTPYTYTVSAYDAEGNESSQSSSASATTRAAPAFIEAQSGTITLPMQIVSDVEASGGAYIQTTQAGSGTAAYAFNIDESGIYKIIARVYAFDASSDSFYVKIDDGEEFVWHLNPSGNLDEFNVWREDEVNNQGTGTWDNPQYDPYTVELTQGTHTITFRGRETNCRLDYFYLSRVEEVSYKWIQAESGNLTSPLETASDTDASAGAYIWKRPGSGGFAGVAEYTIDIPIAGEYVIWGRVIAPDGGSNSFFTSIDAGEDLVWAVQIGSVWTWDLVNGNGQDPLILNLAAGTHTLKISGREDGTKLDRILITNDMEFVPSEEDPDSGPPADVTGLGISW